MKTKILAVCHIRKGDSFLLRKKPDGSPPYKETWYSFGVEVGEGNFDIEKALIESVRDKTGVTIEVTEKLWWDTETKPDHNSEQTFFVYLHTIAEYVKGELQPGKGVEKLQWINANDLGNYTIVPPSRAFLERYLNIT